MDIVSYLLARAGNESGSGETVTHAGVLMFPMIDTEPVIVTEAMLSEVTVIELNGGI